MLPNSKYATNVLYIFVHKNCSRLFYLACPVEFSWKFGVNMEPANTTFRRREGCVPNLKLSLQDQLHEVIRFKQFSLRTE